MKNWKMGSLLVVIGMLVLILAACGSNTNQNNEAKTEPETPAAVQEEGNNQAEEEVAEPAGIDWASRIATNQKAGEINFMTSFQYSASVANVNAWIADEMGFFEELGLNVNVQPGLDGDGMKFLAAGQLQFAHAGSGSVVVQAVNNGAEIKGVSVMAPIGLGAIMVLDESDIHDVKDLEGKTVGYKGAMSANFLAMFEAGGADISKINQVSVGFDPTILNSGNVDAITAFKSNEPAAMERQGFKVRVLEPEEYGVKSSFGVIVANDYFAEQNPTVVEDFLRAIMKAHEWIVANPEETIDILEKRSQGNFSREVETNRLMVETGLAAEHQYEGQGLGYFTAEQWQAEIDMLQDAGVLNGEVTVDDVSNGAYIANIYEGGQLIWPE